MGDGRGSGGWEDSEGWEGQWGMERQWRMGGAVAGEKDSGEWKGQ